MPRTEGGEDQERVFWSFLYSFTGLLEYGMVGKMVVIVWGM